MSDIETVVNIASQNTTLLRALYDIETALDAPKGTHITYSTEYEIIERIILKIIELKKSKKM